ncbi:hypothetical protein BAG01nite_07880 [Brevibacillus agri]|uniref:Uncharacterized protein n=1 Tax=Brevibacillus agri TaxID=51101 RepID=A0A3M8BBA5_9BACL|nr:DUF6530 family protein [Brevibacillus agri]MBY0053622.1 hypothetical protein [Brevibacillus agri]QAV13741.1 hypothetical protein BA6348_13770 [Brevibacillus agri]RNB60327.1 hypothetical protein EB820_02040 [Brevibacillus agri]GED24686.1 hypothetical protein BAG01nite_07880 [Brevibacillus agri]
MKLPTTSQHKPVVVSENYDRVDGRSARNTDVKALSLGLAAKNDTGKAAIAAKAWKSTGEAWSTESEELPLHRILDLSLLVCRTLNHFREAYRYEHFYDPQKPVIDRIALQGDALNVAICTDNDTLHDDIKQFSRVLSEDDELIGERLRALARLLKDMGY